jgi:hypothetical protein
METREKSMMGEFSVLILSNKTELNGGDMREYKNV